jgi:hypothetical protein
MKKRKVVSLKGKRGKLKSSSNTSKKVVRKKPIAKKIKVTKKPILKKKIISSKRTKVVKKPIIKTKRLTLGKKTKKIATSKTKTKSKRIKPSQSSVSVPIKIKKPIIRKTKPAPLRLKSKSVRIVKGSKVKIDKQKPSKEGHGLFWTLLSLLVLLIAVCVLSFFSGLFSSIPFLEMIFQKVNSFLLTIYNFAYSIFTSYTQEVVILFLIILIGIIGGKVLRTFARKIKSKKSGDGKEPKNKEETLVLSPGGYQTGIDVFHQFVLKNQKVSIERAASKLKIKKEVATEWAKVLQEHKLINIDYPAFGSPTLMKFSEEETEEEKEENKKKEKRDKEEQKDQKEQKKQQQKQKKQKQKQKKKGAKK